MHIAIYTNWIWVFLLASASTQRCSRPNRILKFHPPYPPPQKKIKNMHEREVCRRSRLCRESDRNVYSLCHHECQVTDDSWLDRIRLPRLDTDQLVSSPRMRFLQVWKDFSAPVHERPEHNVRVLQRWLLLHGLRLQGDHTAPRI